LAFKDVQRSSQKISENGVFFDRPFETGH
jgi:hypothetical protein